MFGIAGFTAGEADNITIAIDNLGTPYVIYEDATTSNLGGTVMKYNGSSWVTVGALGFTSGRDALNTTMAIDKNGTPYACFQQFPGGKISVMKFNASTDVNSLAGPAATSSIYPNPATTSLTITSSDNIKTIAITNLLGQPIYTHEYNTDKAEVDVSTLLTGIYLIRINGSEVRKFVKE